LFELTDFSIDNLQLTAFQAGILTTLKRCLNKNFDQHQGGSQFVCHSRRQLAYHRQLFATENFKFAQLKPFDNGSDFFFQLTDAKLQAFKISQTGNMNRAAYFN